MRAILIDPHKRLISEISLPDNCEQTYKDIVKALGCDLFCLACNLPRKSDEKSFDSIYVDDEGLFKENNPTFAIKLPGEEPVVFTGRGLILGCDSYGESVSASIDLLAAAMLVDWMETS